MLALAFRKPLTSRAMAFPGGLVEGRRACVAFFDGVAVVNCRGRRCAAAEPWSMGVTQGGI
jgi:hypothetical protein